MKDDLRQQIRNNKLKSGDLILSGPKLCKSYQISYAVACRALNELVEEGLLYRVQGKGTFVANLPRDLLTKRWRLNTKNGSIGICFWNPLSERPPYYSILIEGISKVCHREKRILQLLPLEDRELYAPKNDHILDAIVNRGVEGVVFLSNVNEKEIVLLKTLGINFVHISGGGRTDVYRVFYDIGLAYETSVLHFVKLGYSKVGYIGDPVSDEVAKYDQGYGGPGKWFRLILEKHGVTPRREFFIYADSWSSQGGYEAMKTLVGKKPRPQGVFVGDDMMAMGAIEAVRDAGLKIGQDISIIGCGNFFQSPQLATVDINVAKMGEVGARILLDLIKGKKPKELVQTVNNISLIMGTSCRSL